MVDIDSMYFILAGVALYFLIIMVTIMCSPLSRDIPESPEEKHLPTVAYKLRSRNVPNRFY